MSTSDFSDMEFEDVSELDDSFAKAADHIQRIHASQNSTDLLHLYALYKQATCGPCCIPKPNIFQMQERTKWIAWNDLENMPSSVAKEIYIQKVNNLDPEWKLSMQHKAKNIGNLHNWVVHSIHQAPDDNTEQKADHEKTPFDYVKEGDLLHLQKSLVMDNINQLDEHGMGLIHWATDRNSAEILKHLIAVGVDVNLRDSDQQTALHYAASCGHEECVKILVNANADQAVKDADGLTCIDVAYNANIIAVLSKTN